MSFKYVYDKNLQTLQQLDESSGKLISSMSMPYTDLDKLSFLAWSMAVDETHTFSFEKGRHTLAVNAMNTMLVKFGS